MGLWRRLEIVGRRNDKDAEEQALAQLGNELRAALSRAKLRNSDFAKRLGVSRARASQILAGHVLTIRSLARIANALDCELRIEICPIE